MILRNVLFFICLLLAANATASNVTGRVIDYEAKEPMEYASVALYQSENQELVAGGITDVSGKFTFTKIKAGSYFVQIQFMGYEKQASEVFRISADKPVALGDIALTPSQVLVDEIAVTGTKIQAFNKLDKQLYKADQFESAQGGSAIDVLKNMPSVSVNGLGEISMRGSSGFLLLVNGKPVLADPQSMLSQLPANTIENVELITSPSAKYDPDGKGGIINITTKKGSSDHTGLSINLKGGLPSTTTFGNEDQPVRYAADASFSYQKDKWDITLSGNYARDDLAGFRDGYVRITNPENGTINHFPSAGERSFYRYNYMGRASVSYAADENNVISLGVYSGKRYQERDANIFYKNSQTDLQDNFIYHFNYYNPNKQIKQGTFTLGNLDYTHTFANQSHLTLSGLYEYDDLYGNTHNYNLSRQGGEVLQYVQNPYEKPIKGYRLKADYRLPVASGMLETGYQFRNDRQDGVFDYLVTPFDPNQPGLDQFSGTAVSKNRINSAYVQYSAQRDRLEYSAGLRYEYSSRTVVLSTDPNPHKLKLSNLFPSISALYALDNDWKVKGAYSRRIQRSSNNQLNPIPEREHSETLEIGDPDLRPELINSFELGLIKTFDKGSLFTTAYYRSSKDPVQRVNSVYADTILNRVYTNVEKATALGLELGVNVQPVSWWNFYLGTTIYKQKYEGDLVILGEPVRIDPKDDWVYSINANTNFTLAPTWSLDANVNYLSVRPTAQGEDSRFLSPNLSLKKSLFNNRMTASVQWQNIDLGMHESNRQRITTWGKDFYTTTNYIYETDMILVNLSFNLNKKNINSKLPKSEFGEKEF
ncbi:TonB-dependent receptor [uncultured Sunxiuqinia sp.]|uniref:TonB-dependent receptor domain-containing protein n=1 Tax=uncultured Sunxiuqinia sp. TaxID=1573825 RepID=UPI002607A540|nr:TonB-dependent receptor [uncultured Sunxiuqinia sp.]